MGEALLTILAGLLILVGLAGIFVPGLPDMLLIWLGALGYGLLVGWGAWGPWLFALITLLGLAGMIAELWTSSVGAKMGGASIWGIFAGMAMGVIGFFSMGPLGGLLGLLLGPLVVEYLRQKDLRKAIQATFGLGLGYGASFGVKLVLGLMMAAAWVAWLILG